MSASNIEEVEVDQDLSCGCKQRSFPKIERYNNYDAKIYVRGYHKPKQILPNPLKKCKQHFPEDFYSSTTTDKSIANLVRSLTAYDFNITQANVLIQAIMIRVKV